MSVVRKSTLRTVAVIVSGAMAILYLLIGFKAIPVDGVTDVEAGHAVPLVIAGVVFSLLTVALLLVGKRLVWAIAAFVPALSTVGYLAISTQRTPSFEPWGLVMHALQLVLVAALVVLAVAGAQPSTAAPIARTVRAPRTLRGDDDE
jgi:hypothetical protein